LRLRYCSLLEKSHPGKLKPEIITFISADPSVAIHWLTVCRAEVNAMAFDLLAVRNIELA